MVPAPSLKAADKAHSSYHPHACCLIPQEVGGPARPDLDTAIPARRLQISACVHGWGMYGCQQVSK